MKKIFYIVLVIVALMVISRFVKENNKEEATPVVVETIDTEAVGNAEIAAPEENAVEEEETVVEGVDDNGMEEETVIESEETSEKE